MSYLYQAYLHSFVLNWTIDMKFYSYIKDIYFTDEVQSMAIFPQHGEINRLQHITSVAYLSYVIAKKHQLDLISTLHGAILHDLVYYDWHQADDGSHRLHGFRHPGFAAVNARLLYPKLTEKERMIILRHMWPLTLVPPNSKEGLIVSMADKYCALQEMLLSTNALYYEKFKKDLKILVLKFELLK